MQLRTTQDLGNAVRATRLRQGLTQQEVAQRAGLSRQWLAGLERGSANPTWDVVLRLAGALRATVSFDPEADQDADSDGASGPPLRSPVDLDALLSAHRGA